MQNVTFPVFPDGLKDFLYTFSTSVNNHVGHWNVHESSERPLAPIISPRKISTKYWVNALRSFSIIFLTANFVSIPARPPSKRGCFGSTDLAPRSVTFWEAQQVMQNRQHSKRTTNNKFFTLYIVYKILGWAFVSSF